MKQDNNLILYRKAKLRTQHEDLAADIASKFKLSLVTARILAARGYQSDDELGHYLNPSLRKTLLNPKSLKNLDKAAKLIAQHANNNNSIAICCDFDVDGLTGASQLISFLNTLDVNNKIFVPDRFKDGYGLNTTMVDSAKKDGCSLLVAIDYGTTNIKELEYAKKLGLETIVIDHHHAGEVPPSDVFVNPQQKDCNFANGILCSAGLIWYLLIVLKKQFPNAEDIDLKQYLDLACLGTICDMVPLTGVNRLIAKKGLEQLSSSKRVGIQALKQVVGVKNKVTSQHVGFGIGPRINAAGRMLNGEVVVDLLTTNDKDKAKKVASKLNHLNSDRQDVENRIKNQAINQINSLPKLPYGIVVGDKTYHTGVIGIVAQRLVETFYRPSIVIGSDDGKFKGSVRGIAGFSVVEALEDLSAYFTKFGGHTGAGGFSLKDDNIDEFAQAFNQTCEKLLQDIELVPTSTADAEVSFAELDTVLCDELRDLSPFGIGNPSPQLYIKNLKVKDIKVLKSAHLKATLTDGKRYIPGLIWNCARHPLLFAGSNINIVCKAEVNEYQGYRNVQLNLQAIEQAR